MAIDLREREYLVIEEIIRYRLLIIYLLKDLIRSLIKTTGSYKHTTKEATSWAISLVKRQSFYNPHYTLDTSI